MSYIFPSGTKKAIFSDKADSDFEKNNDKENKQEETAAKEDDMDMAEENKDAVVEEDFALSAIKDLPEVKDKATALLNEIKGKVEEVAEVIKEETGKADGAQAKVEEIAAIVQDATPVDTPIEDKTLEKTDLSINENKSSEIPGVEEKDSVEPVEEIEINIEDDDNEVEIGIEKDPEKDVGADDIVKKSKESCGCSAKSKGEFVRLAKLSPKNREAVKEYWLALGFPKDYVEAMIKDY